MAKILYHAVPVPWRKEEKYAFLEKTDSVAGVKWKNLKPDKKQNWLDHGYREEFDDFLPIGDRDLLPGNSMPTIFSFYSRGIATSRDETAVNFSRERVAKNMEAMIDAYNGQVDAYHRLKKKPAKIEDFIDYESGKIKWSRDLKNDLLRHRRVEFTDDKLQRSHYRPFTATWLFFDRVMNEEVYGFPSIFPKPNTKNTLIWLKVGSDWPMFALSSNRICDLMPQGGSQCFPLFTYSEDGKERRDNITPKALTLFQIFYDDDGITREDIFHYVYALLHHPAYRTRYAENLKRELPRIPFVGVGRASSRAGLGTPKSSGGGSSVASPHQGQFFPLSAVEKMQGDAKPDHDPKASAKLFHTFAAAGKKLADLHVNYESAPEFKLKRQENKDVKLDYRVEAMKLVGQASRLSPSSPGPKRSETAATAVLRYNDFLTLSGIPAEVFDYRLGNRSALEWVIDQYRVTKDDNGSITSDPNRLDDEQYILRLIGQVITVSLETVRVVKGLPGLEK